MARLSSILKINGTLDGMTFYNLPGVAAPVVRSTWGASKEALLTQPRYAATRRTMAETGGRGKAVHWLMKAFQPLKPLADFDTAGQLHRLLRAVQKGDTESPWGERGVRVSRFPQLLEGFHLTKATPFDATVRGEAYAKMNKTALQATVELPPLLPGLTFFPPKGVAYCRLVATLGVAPDVAHGPLGWTTGGDYTNCFALAAHTEWFAAGAGLPPTTLSLHLPYTPPTEAYALVLAVAVQLGIPVSKGTIEPVHGRVGSAKILAAG